MYDDVKPVEEAHLDCYVNGKLVTSTDKVTEPDRFSYYANAIRFKAPFNAGDEVRITVDAGDAHAEVTGVAPKSPVVNAVDTSSFMAKNKGGELAAFYMTKYRPAVHTRKASSCAGPPGISSSTTSTRACCTGI